MKPSPKPAPPPRDDTEPDLTPGARTLEEATREPCVWDQDITYELQVELALTLLRLQARPTLSAIG